MEKTKSWQILLLWIILLAVPGNADGQEFSRELKSSTFSFSDVLAADGQHIYLHYGKGRYFHELPSAQWIYKLDHQLNLKDSLNVTAYLALDSAEEYFLRALTLDPRGDLYALGFVRRFPGAANCMRFRSILLKINKSLQVLDSIGFDVDTAEVAVYDMNISDSILVAVGSAYNCQDSSRIINPYAVRVNINTRQVVQKDYADIAVLFSEFRGPVQFQGKIVTAVAPHGLRVDSGQRLLATVVLDDSLNIIYEGDVVDQRGPAIWYLNLPGFGAFIPVSKDSIWKLSSAASYRRSIPPPGGSFKYWNFGASLLDSGYNVTQIDTFPLSGHYSVTPNSVQYSSVQASRDPYDYRVVDSVLYVQGEKYIQYDNYSSQDSTAFYLYNFNARQGKMNWIRRVQRNYTIGQHAVAALPGNRWALSFSEYNWDKYQGPNLAVHLWILNGAGDIISQRERLLELPQLQIYPNPASDYLYVDHPSAKLEEWPYCIYNQRAQLLQSGQVGEEGRLAINNLPPGIYLLATGETSTLMYATFQKR